VRERFNLERNRPPTTKLKINHGTLFAPSATRPCPANQAVTAGCSDLPDVQPVPDKGPPGVWRLFGGEALELRRVRGDFLEGGTFFRKGSTQLMAVCMPFQVESGFYFSHPTKEIVGGALDDSLRKPGKCLIFSVGVK
jgi:hypothetical protein